MATSQGIPPGRRCAAQPSRSRAHPRRVARRAVRRRSRYGSKRPARVERQNAVRHASKERLVARIPADVEMPDKVIANLTVRQAAIFAGTGILAAWVYLMAGHRLPVPVLAAILVPLIAAGSALALGQRDGLGLDRLCLHALAHVRSNRKLITAEEGVPEPPAWCRAKGRLPGALRLPVRAIREDGVMELAEGGTAAVVRAGTVPFGLRTAEEQTALVGVFAGWLNSLDAPVQILLQARPVNLSHHAGRITATAAHLPDPALEQAARQHAAFLTDLATTRDLLTRDVLVVVRHHDTARRDSSAAITARRADETARSLCALGVHAEVMNADEARDLLVRSLSPSQAGTARPDELITCGEDAS
ncbi:hypothetical protein C1I98_36400 [Spongiactinospora gelatinilytica]|uniref:PrgI family protein n=1 Tax=Spongiactinospora gelatinilytica TaxID=2666298 RepID=A0A2W2EFG1_9ACTN|nr:hypothetical protein C1I98_36400 [Spongiactinospora gelatinilytica]